MVICKPSKAEYVGNRVFADVGNQYRNHSVGKEGGFMCGLHVSWQCLCYERCIVTIPRNLVLRWVLLIPSCGLFMCPFAVAGLGLRYLRISFSFKYGHPLRKPFCTACDNVDIFGLHNNWCANLAQLECVRTECVKDARLTVGCKSGQK
jgi:hypothetical protein